MNKPTGNHWLNDSFVVGTREDQAPRPLPPTVFTHQCKQCGAKTLTETAYPDDIAVVCAVCARAITKEIEEDKDTLLLYTLPVEVKAQLIDLAFHKRLPVEQVLQGFVDWKLGRVTNATLFAQFEKHGS
jgi:recombinational DNA repair protein (RecF pathway)